MTHGDPGVTALASPNLALVKYWGKAPGGVNLPATPSLGISLAALETRTVVRRLAATSQSNDRVEIAGEPQRSSRFEDFFENIRSELGAEIRFDAQSRNNFPTAAGLASSASGFAALSLACAELCECPLSPAKLSAIARVGSGSAARSVFGGFVVFPAGSPAAESFAPPDHWPELRVLICRVSESEKAISSRAGMEHTRRTSPFYENWVTDAESVYNRACRAVEQRDLEGLGEAMRESYLRMFATMISAGPPFLYWQPESVALIHLCERLRRNGIAAWETMDAGPQVKILTLSSYVPMVRAAVEQELTTAHVLESEVGLATRLAERGPS
jgi:diphosphomevalonate decarboxylase